MAYITPVSKNHEDYAYVIKGTLYRCKVSIIDWVKYVNDRARFDIAVYVLEQSYHKYSAYRIVGDCVYRGISLKGAWDEVESYVGSVEMPDKLKQLQPFIAEQT
jgi:hypothetical protein